MPFGDRTGPNGMGSRTGRGAGFCNGYGMPGYVNGTHYGRGRGFGRSRGMAFGRGQYGYTGYDAYYPPVNPNIHYSKENEKTYIENEITFLKEQLQQLESRLSEIQKEDE